MWYPAGSLLALVAVLRINDSSSFLVPTPWPSVLRNRFFLAHDVKVQLPGGAETKTLSIDEDKTILVALEEHDVDAPHSCRSGLCTECAALVTGGRENVHLEAAVLDPAVTEMGFVLTCSASIIGPGVELELGVGEKMYEAQYGSFREDHKSAQSSRPGSMGLPLTDISGA
ncbi:unnamed protein product [Choristocarpus tenellus]